MTRPAPVSPRLAAVALAAALLGTVAAAPLRAQTFEGVVTMTLNPGPGQHVATTWVKGRAMRMQLAGTGASGLGGMVVRADGTMLMLNAQARQYVVMANTADIRRMGRTGTGAVDAASLGRSELVGGTRCDWYRFTRAGKPLSEMCVAQGLGDFGTRDQSPLDDADLARLRAKFPRGFFPLKSREPGTGKVAFEVTKVERRAVTPAELDVPAGWTEMKAPRAPGR